MAAALGPTVERRARKARRAFLVIGEPMVAPLGLTLNAEHAKAAHNSSWLVSRRPLRSRSRSTRAVPSNHRPSVGYAAEVVVIVLGAAGAGKTTIGRALAARHGWRFADGDDFHAPQAIAKMRSGIGLTDADRQPWLASLHALVAAAIDRREALVLACSALKQRYRDTLRDSLRPVRFVYLQADAATLRERLQQRASHFVGPTLLTTQLADLEEPDDALTLTVDATRLPEQILDTIDDEFGL